LEQIRNITREENVNSMAKLIRIGSLLAENDNNIPKTEEQWLAVSKDLGEKTDQNRYFNLALLI